MAAAAAATGRQEQQMWWRDVEEEIGGDGGFVLPPPVVTGIDEFGFRNGEYSFDDKDNKVTTHVREPAPAPRSATESRSWPKFFGSVKEDDSSRLTMVSTGEIILKRLRASGSKAGVPTTSGEPLDMTSKGGDCSMLKCPYKDLRQQIATYVEISPSARETAEPPVCPICMRAADRSVDDMMGFGVDDTSIRVTNLSENTSEHDLYNLVFPFGIVNGHSLALDEKSESCRQFGIVEFDQREDAEAAVNWLDGYCFDGLTLQVERITSGLNEAVDSPPICSICMRVAETSVHLTNLSEDTCELDLYHLCFPFGIINSVYLSSDKTGSGKQVGIVEFDQREDTEAAIRWLNGYEYANNTLQVKLATVAELGSAKGQKRTSFC